MKVSHTSIAGLLESLGYSLQANSKTREVASQGVIRVDARIDENIYKTGIKVTDEEMDALNIIRDDFHGEWNYELRPQQKVLDL